MTSHHFIRNDIIEAIKMHFLKSTKVEGTQEEYQVLNQVNELFIWLTKTPTISTFRINTLITQRQLLLDQIKSYFSKYCEDRNYPSIIDISTHAILEDVIIISNLPVEWLDLKPRNKEVIIDTKCGAAVLRGAHIFAPGVLGLETGTQLDDEISVYVDLTGKCKQGFNKKFEEPKLFVGNGILKIIRKELFNNENIKKTGIAVEITNSVSGCPNFDEVHLKRGDVLLQNLPSIVACHVLNPLPNEHVLDMCAAPGNKTTHLGAIMKNQGHLIAIEKISSKIQPLKEKCKEFYNDFVQVYQFDSTKILQENIKNKSINDGPPFSPNSFDKILLDAPCSGLGQRPLLRNNISLKELESYSKLQKKLFNNAVELLQPGGTLVYTTCTITLAENEELVAWALNKYEQLKLIPATPTLGNPGWKISALDQEQCNCLQRFGPSYTYESTAQSNLDSIGFFIAHFKKKG